MIAYEYVQFYGGPDEYRAKWVQGITVPEHVGWSGVLPLHGKTPIGRKKLYVAFWRIGMKSVTF